MSQINYFANGSRSNWDAHLTVMLRNVPPQLAALLRSMLTFDPDMRPSATALLGHADLRRVPDAAPITFPRDFDLNSIAAIPLRRSVRSIAAIDTTRVVCGTSDGIIGIWNFALSSCTESTILCRANESGTPVRCLCVLAGSAMFASGSEDGTVSVWRVRNGTCVAAQRGTGTCFPVTHLANLMYGVIASGDASGTVRFWGMDGLQGNDLRPIARYDSVGGSKLRTMIALRDGRLLGGFADGSIRVWDVAGDTRRSDCISVKVVREPVAGRSGAWAVCESANGRVFVGESTGEISLLHLGNRSVWSSLIESAQPVVFQAEKPRGGVRSIVGIGSLCIYAACTRGFVRAWDVRSSTVHAVYSPTPPSGASLTPRLLQLCAGGKCIVAGIGLASKDHSIRIFDQSKPRSVRRLIGHTDTVHDIVQLSGGNLASCCADGTVRVWST